MIAPNFILTGELFFSLLVAQSQLEPLPMALPSPESLAPSPKTITFASATADPDAIVESLATDTVEVVLTDVELDGVIGASTVRPAARFITVTTTADTGSYNTVDPIVVVGYDCADNLRSIEFTLTEEDGNETLTSELALSQVLSITIPAQADANGAFTFGVGDISLPQARQIRIGGSGNLKVEYLDGVQDTIPSLVAGERLDINPAKIIADGDTTVTNITILF